MSTDNYLLVDHDGRKYLLYEGSMSANEDPDYEPPLYDVAKTADGIEDMIEEYGAVEYGVEWTDDAKNAAGLTMRATSKVIEQLSELNIKVVNMWTDDARIAAGITTKAVSKVIEQLSELNIKVVNMANKLDEHLKEVDAHHPALMGKKK